MKKPATVTGDGGGALDLISKLPDELLVRILYLLPTTKAAVKTCVLSKRWRYLWTSIEKLNLVCETKSEADKLVPFLNHVFTQRNYSKIRKFYLNCWDMPSYTLHIEQWLAYLVQNKVEHVVLESPYFTLFNLPKILYTCSSLIELVLFNCEFDKGAVITWKSLKSVKFITVQLDDELIVKLLSGCPVLETLELYYFHGFRSLEIKNPNVKTLKLREFWPLYEEDDHELDIVAPYLQHLEISGRLSDFKCRLVNVSSLVSAELTFVIKCEFDYDDFVDDEADSCLDYHLGFRTLVQDYLRKLNHVPELTFGTWFVEVLFKLQLDGVRIPELKCKCLTLKLFVTKSNLCGVASLLRASPHVETLNINLDADVKCYHCRYESSYLEEEDHVDLQSWIPNFTFPSLKSVNILCSGGLCLKEPHDRLFELSKFLLKNAIVLEKFVIISKRGKCLCPVNCVSSYSSILAAKLLGCPRSSTNSTKFMLILRESYSELFWARPPNLC